MKRVELNSLDANKTFHDPVHLIITGKIDHGIVLNHTCAGSVVEQKEEGQLRSLDIRADHTIAQGLNFRERNLRIRFGASHCLIKDCSFIRKSEGMPTHDIVAIQIEGGTSSRGENLSCRHNVIENNVMVNYTDGIQLTDTPKNGISTTDCAGTRILNNRMGFSVNQPGTEQCGDFKIGGTEEHPVIIEGNTFFGCRKYPNPKNPTVDIFGYALTLKNFADHICIWNNTFVDCDYAVQMTRQNRPGVPIYVPDYEFLGNEYFNVDEGIKTGADEYKDWDIGWPEQVTSVSG